MDEKRQERIRYYSFAAFVGALLLLNVTGVLLLNVTGVWKSIFGIDTAVYTGLIGSSGGKEGSSDVETNVLEFPANLPLSLLLLPDCRSTAHGEYARHESSGGRSLPHGPRTAILADNTKNRRKE